MKRTLILCMAFLMILATTTLAQDPPKITGPWLWVTAPTPECGEAAVNSGTDYLAEASGGAVTEADVAANGANEGDAVGDKVWTLAEIADTGSDNLNDLMTAIGLGEGDIDNTVAYGVITLNVAQATRCVMRVGTDDAVRVWLNGAVVWENAVNRGASDYIDSFNVDVNQGDNILMVATYECGGGWSTFAGIDADFEAAGVQYAAVGLPLVPDPPSGPWIMEWYSMSPITGTPDIGTGIATDYLMETFGREEATFSAMGYIPPPTLTAERNGETIEWFVGNLGEVENSNNLSVGIYQSEYGADLNNYVYYGMVGVIASEAMDTIIHIAQDDDLKLWVNGVFIAEWNGWTGGATSTNPYEIHLNQGANVVMVKVSEGGGGDYLNARFQEDNLEFNAEVYAIEGMSVSPAGKLSTKWGDIKSR